MLLDADIRGFYDSPTGDGPAIHRAPDRGPSLLRLIQKWMNAGVMEAGELSRKRRGVPQGQRFAPAGQPVLALRAGPLGRVMAKAAGAWRGDVVRFADDTPLAFSTAQTLSGFSAICASDCASLPWSCIPKDAPDGIRPLCEPTSAGTSEKGKPETLRLWDSRISVRETQEGKFRPRQTMRKRCGSDSRRSRPSYSAAGISPSPNKVGARAARSADTRVPRGPDEHPRIAVLPNLRRAPLARSLRRRSQRHCLDWERMRKLGTMATTPRILHPLARRAL